MGAIFTGEEVWNKLGAEAFTLHGPCEVLSIQLLHLAAVTQRTGKKKQVSLSSLTYLILVLQGELSPLITAILSKNDSTFHFSALPSLRNRVLPCQ